jgi:phospho-N-acetylmuramoyl-pentapeptide-transferase
MLFHLFQTLRSEIGFFNVFRYVSTRMGLATLTALLVTFSMAPWFIRRARERQLGEVIRDDGPATHAGKKGTPTMGGALIIMALVLATLLWCDLTSPLVWPALLVTLGYGLLGFVDDYIKIVKKNKKGVPAKAKLVVQFVVGAGAIAWLFWGGAWDADLRGQLSVPLMHFGRMPLELPLAVYFALGLIVVVGMSNGVNLTDGLDGLAIGPVIISAFTWMLLAYATGAVLMGFNVAEYLGTPHIKGAGELAVFCGAIGGAGIGFLWFNTHPAQVFMGDVGALALGGALGFVALATKTELSLPIIGGLFVIELLSDIIQVAYYKRTKRRVFLMAPIHHHFEKKGWPESRIVVRAWIIAFSFAVAGLLVTLKVR